MRRPNGDHINQHRSRPTQHLHTRPTPHTAFVHIVHSRVGRCVLPTSRPSMLGRVHNSDPAIRLCRQPEVQPAGPCKLLACYAGEPRVAPELVLSPLFCQQLRSARAARIGPSPATSTYKTLWFSKSPAQMQFAGAQQEEPVLGRAPDAYTHFLNDLMGTAAKGATSAHWSSHITDPVFPKELGRERASSDESGQRSERVNPNESLNEVRSTTRASEFLTCSRFSRTVLSKTTPNRHEVLLRGSF